MSSPIALLLSVLPSYIKIFAYRLLGMKIGRDVRIGFGTLLLCSRVELLDGAQIGHFCLIRANELRMGKRATISNLVRIAAFSVVMKSQSTIGSQNEISGVRTDPRSTLYLGPASFILPHCFVNVFRPVHLGRNVGLGGGSYLFTHGVWLSKLDGFPVSYGGITIEDDVWLPWSCFIMPNVTIGTRTIVGARSLVNKSLPAGVLAAGAPAKILREKSNIDLTPEERAQVLADISKTLGGERGVTARIDSTANADIHYLDGERLLVLHKAAGEPLAAFPTLNVVFDDLDREAASRSPIWSLADYASSPYALISPPARRWFSQARDVGVRFYPIDEDAA